MPRRKKSTHFGGQSYKEHPANSPRTPRRRPIAASVPRLDRTSRENPSPRTQQTPAPHHQTLFHAARLCEMKPSAGTPKEGGVRSNRRPAGPMPTVGERHRSCHAALRRLAHGGALMRRYRAQAPADKHAGRARRLRNPLIRSSLHACRDHRDACRSTDYANYPSLSRIVDRGRYRKPVPRVPKPLKKAR